MPRITFVTPCFNAEAFVGDAMRSVLAQRCTDWEYILVDDSSSDRSVEVIEGFAAQDPRIRLLRQRNSGGNVARNRGFAAASPSSVYVWFLDADDVLEENAAAILMDYLDQHPEVGLVYCATRHIGLDGQFLYAEEALKPRYVPDGFGWQELPPAVPETPIASLMSNFEAVTSACLMRRRVFEQTARWDERLPRFQDKDMVLQMSLRAPVHFIPVQLVRRRIHDTNLHKRIGNRTGLEILEQKWWRGLHLTPSEQSLARQAILFDRRLAGTLQLRGAVDAARNGELRSAGRLFLRAGRKLERYTLGWLTEGIRGMREQELVKLRRPTPLD